MRHALNEIGDDLMEMLLQFQKYRHPVEEAKKAFLEVVRLGQCYQLKQLALTGNDLIAMGIKPGRQIGEYLQDCLALVLDEPDKNEKAYLRTYVETLQQK